MKKLLFFGALALLANACNGNQSAMVNTTAESQNQANVQNQGRVVFSVADAAANTQNLTAVNLTVDKVEAHSASGAWATVSTDSRSFDLLELKTSGQAEVLTDAQLAVGTYDQIRLHVSQVTVTDSSGKQSAAKLPSSELKIVGKIVVMAGADASVKLDFELDKSLHLTGSGQFILTPVIKLDSLSGAQVEVDSDNTVKIGGGKQEDSETFGTDISGETKANFTLNSDANLDVTANGAIHLKDNSQAEKTEKIDAQTAVKIAMDKGEIDVAISVVLETQGGKAVWHVTGTHMLEVKNIFIDAGTGAVISAD